MKKWQKCTFFKIFLNFVGNEALDSSKIPTIIDEILLYTPFYKRLYVEMGIKTEGSKNVVYN